MAIDIPATLPKPVKSADAPPPPPGTPTASKTPGIADNFQTFLTLLTTQLKNQNPLDPLDTNQFTQQLVQFAQVEQQLKSNDQLSTLVSIDKSAQSTQALGFVGATVAVDGSTAELKQDKTGASTAAWHFNSPKDASAAVSITNSAGQTVFTLNANVPAGGSSFTWDGKGNDGTQWPPGNYKMTVTSKDDKGNDVAIPTEVVGTVDSVDLTATPALLSIGGQNYTVDKIKRVGVPPSTAGTNSTGDKGTTGGTGTGSSGSSGSTGGTSGNSAT